MGISCHVSIIIVITSNALMGTNHWLLIWYRGCGGEKVVDRFHFFVAFSVKFIQYSLRVGGDQLSYLDYRRHCLKWTDGDNRKSQLIEIAGNCHSRQVLMAIGDARRLRAGTIAKGKVHIIMCTTHGKQRGEL
jgi:hypothetical protein